jgi:hypothetical protein
MPFLEKRFPMALDRDAAVDDATATMSRHPLLSLSRFLFRLMVILCSEAKHNGDSWRVSTRAKAVQRDGRSRRERMMKKRGGGMRGGDGEAEPLHCVCVGEARGMIRGEEVGGA